MTTSSTITEQRHSKALLAPTISVNMPENGSTNRFLFPTPESQVSDDKLQPVSSPEEFPPFRRSGSNDRWTPRKSSQDRRGSRPYSSPYRHHASKRSVSEALDNFRARRGSVSANAQELADALSAPVSYKLIVCFEALAIRHNIAVQDG